MEQNYSLYKKISRSDLLRNQEWKIKWELIELFWKSIYNESFFNIKDTQLQIALDYQKIIIEIKTNHWMFITPTMIWDFHQWLYKRILKDPDYRNKDTNEIDRDKVHKVLSWDLIWDISMKAQSHIEYSEEYITKELKIFFEENDTRSPKKLEKSNSKLYNHLIKNYKWIEKNRDYWQNLQTKYWRNENILKYQYYDGKLEIEKFKSFFEQHKKKYWNSFALLKFDPSFCRKLRSIKVDWKVDRLYILYKFVPKEYISQFRHKNDDMFKQKLTHSSITDQLEKYNYRLVSDELAPDEIFEKDEERMIMNEAIAKLSQDEQYIIKDFMDEKDVDISQLENIILKLRKIIV